MDLIATPKNPIPIGASTGYIEPRKGLRLRFASWQSALRERRGTVCIFQGRAEFIEKYFEVVGELRRRGFAVAIFDWRGQGGSTRLTRDPRKGHINDFAEYEEDLNHFMKAVVLPDCPAPYYALGHSMGAMVLFRASTKRGCWFTRMIMTSPMLRIAELPFSYKICGQLTDGLTMLGFGKQTVPGDAVKHRQDPPFEGNRLTSDRERFLRNVSVLDAAPQLADRVADDRLAQGSAGHDRNCRQRKVRAAHPGAGSHACRRRRSSRVDQSDRGALLSAQGRRADRAERLAPRDFAGTGQHSRTVLGGVRRLCPRYGAEQSELARQHRDRCRM